MASSWRMCRVVAAFPCSIESVSTPTFFISTKPIPATQNRYSPLFLEHGTMLWNSQSRHQQRSVSTVVARAQRDLIMREILEAEDETSSSDESSSETENIYEMEQGEFEEDEYWEDVDYSAATMLANNIARLKRTQLALIVPEVKKWMSEGHPATKHTFLYVIRKLRRRNRYSHAVKLANWLAEKKPVPHEVRDDIRRVELHGRCGWYQMAERIFQRIPDEDKNEDAYNALLLAYSKAKMLRKSEFVFNKLRKERMITSPYAFNLMASLYRRRGLEVRVLDLEEQAIHYGIDLDMCFKNILMVAKHKVDGIEAAEKVYQEIKSSRQRSHITTYVAMAGCYASEEMFDKAESVLQEIEHGMEIGQFAKLRTAYNTLITMYARIKKPEGIKRAWKELLKLGDPISPDFISVIKSWGKLGEVENSENLFKQAEGYGKLSSSPIFSAMFFVYSHMGMLSRADALMNRMKHELGVKLDPWCYFHLIELYVKKGMTQKAIEILRESQVAGNRGPRSRPLPASLALVLGSVAEIPDVDLGERLLEDWRLAGYWLNSSVYNKLLEVYVKARRPAYGFVERMLQNNVRPNLKTELLFKELREMKADEIDGAGDGREDDPGAAIAEDSM